MPDPDELETPTDGDAPRPARPALHPVHVDGELQIRLVDLIGESMRGQLEGQGRLLWAIVIGGVLNTTIVALLMGGNLAISLGVIDVRTGSPEALAELGASSSATAPGTSVPEPAEELAPEAPTPEELDP